MAAPVVCCRNTAIRRHADDDEYLRSDGDRGHAHVTYILISHVNDPYRRIYTDGRDWPAEDEFVPTYAGYSIGKWIDEDGDGKLDVLEVETRHLLNPRVYDASGLPFHTDGKTIVKERIYLDKADKDILYDEITVFDNALTRPWSITKKAKRSPKARPLWRTAVCAEENARVKVENENYFLSADGKLMPTRKDQPPPDLQYSSQGAVRAKHLRQVSSATARTRRTWGSQR
jgi:hypothetical protein